MKTRLESEKNVQVNDPVMISKRMFNFFVGVLFFLMTSVLVLMGMIWKLNNKQQETRAIINQESEVATYHSEAIVVLQELTKVQGETIRVLTAKLESISKFCCAGPSNETGGITTTRPDLPAVKPQIGDKMQLKLSQKRSGADCIVQGVNVCVPLIATPEATTQNETELSFLPCRCAKVLRSNSVTTGLPSVIPTPVR